MSLPPLKPTPRELQFMRDNQGKLTQKEMAKQLARSHTLVGRWMKELGLKHKIPGRVPAKKSGVLGWGKGAELQSMWR